MIYSVLLVTLLAVAADAKVFTNCELASTLLSYGAPRDQLATWVCIAYQESRYNTQAVNTANSDGSNDFGIFQINNRYWCYPGTGCSTSCDNFLNDDISDDFKCSQTIYDQTAASSGDGFTAWTTYPDCKGNSDSYLDGCNV